MPWKTIDTREFAKRLGIDMDTIDAKHELMLKIRDIRKKQGLTQKDLGDLIGKSQSYVAKVESGVGNRNFSFDVLFGILKKLGYRYKITTHKISGSKAA